jgi:hypothetical protein
MTKRAKTKKKAGAERTKRRKGGEENGRWSMNRGKTMKPQSWLTSYFFQVCIGEMEREEWEHKSKDEVDRKTDEEGMCEHLFALG